MGATVSGTYDTIHFRPLAAAHGQERKEPTVCSVASEEPPTGRHRMQMPPLRPPLLGQLGTMPAVLTIFWLKNLGVCTEQG